MTSKLNRVKMSSLFKAFWRECKRVQEYSFELKENNSLCLGLCVCIFANISHSHEHFRFFSSAFNAIQPLLLNEKLRVMGVNGAVVSLITDYLTGGPQLVRVGNGLFDVVLSGTGAPQGTVLCPFRSTLYTTDSQYTSESRRLQKC